MFSDFKGTMCPAEIPNGQLSDSCFPKASAICDNFTCDQGYDRNKVVKSLICNESGLWNYDLSMLCIGMISFKFYFPDV